MTTSNGSCGFVSERKPSDSVRGLFMLCTTGILPVLKSLGERFLWYINLN
ncbi:MAG: hypothetical protein U5N85_07790 [Arcicella sp.]|nr:hypothetical protein [Arcicella sp.]